MATTVSQNTLPHSATDVLERFGLAARGDRVYRAGRALEQLLRAVYLSDYFAGLPPLRIPSARAWRIGPHVAAAGLNAGAASETRPKSGVADCNFRSPHVRDELRDDLEPTATAARS